MDTIHLPNMLFNALNTGVACHSLHTNDYGSCLHFQTLLTSSHLCWSKIDFFLKLKKKKHKNNLLPFSRWRTWPRNSSRFQNLINIWCWVRLSRKEAFSYLVPWIFRQNYSDIYKLIDLYYSHDHLITCKKAVTHWCEIKLLGKESTWKTNRGQHIKHRYRGQLSLLYYPLLARGSNAGTSPKE